MNGGPRRTSTASPLKNVDPMEKPNSYRNGIPKDLPNRSRDSHWIGDVDEKEAEESLAMYCKPVELYNMIRERCEQQPLYLQRCLSYKNQTPWQLRTRLTLSVTGYVMGKMKTKDPGSTNGAFEHIVFVMVTSQMDSPSEGEVVYRLGRTQVLSVGECLLSSSDQPEVSFILPKLKKLKKDTKIGDVILFIICGSGDMCVENDEPAETLSKFSGRVVWGKLAISSLWMNLLQSNKEMALRTIIDRDRLETTSHVDLCQGNILHDDSPHGRIIKLGTSVKTAAERSLVQLQVHLIGGEFREPSHKDKAENGTVSKTPRPYSLSHTWRSRVGRVVFHYLYYHGMLRKTEVTEDFSCPFCLSRCACFKGLRCHLNVSHDLFNFEYLVSGELQVVNVTCRPDLVRPQGTVRDLDGLSDPRVKNYFYWYKQSRFRRRKFPISSEHLEVQDGTREDSVRVDTPSHVAVDGCLPGSSALHQMRDLHTVCLDTNGSNAALEEVEEQHLEGGSLEVSTGGQVSNGTHASLPNGTIDGSRKKEFRHGDRPSSSEPEQKSKSGKTHDTHSMDEAVKERNGHALKRQRMKGVISERTVIRSRPRASFGGACASAGGQDLDDCGMQQGPVANGIGPDRLDIQRTHARLEKRQYFHSHTAQPMDAEELLEDKDSEDELDNVIADLEDRRLLDDFVDVTSEEKEIMRLWNSFVRRNHVVADGHCPWACREFSKENAKRFGENPALRRCLMLFLVKLWNHHLVDGETIDHCLMSVDSYEAKEKDEQKKLGTSGSSS